MCNQTIAVSTSDKDFPKRTRKNHYLGTYNGGFLGEFFDEVPGRSETTVSALDRLQRRVPLTVVIQHQVDGQDETRRRQSVRIAHDRHGAI